MRSAALAAILALGGCGRSELLFDVVPVGMEGGAAGNPGSTGGNESGGTSTVSLSASGGTTTGGSTEGGATTGVKTSASTSSGGCPDADRPWLLFELDDTDATRLYAMRSDGSSGHRVPLVHDSQLYASISADGTKLLYVVFEPETDGGYDGTLYLEDLTTRTATALLTSGQPLYSSLSGDGQTIAYTQGQGVYVMGSDGQHSRLVVEAPSGATFGDGHPLFVGATTTFLYGAYEAFAAIKTDGSDNVTLVTEANVDVRDHVLEVEVGPDEALHLVVAKARCEREQVAHAAEVGDLARRERQQRSDLLDREVRDHALLLGGLEELSDALLDDRPLERVREVGIQPAERDAVVEERGERERVDETRKGSRWTGYARSATKFVSGSRRCSTLRAGGELVTCGPSPPEARRFRASAVDRDLLSSRILKKRRRSQIRLKSSHVRDHRGLACCGGNKVRGGGSVIRRESPSQRAGWLTLSGGHVHVRKQRNLREMESCRAIRSGQTARVEMALA